MRINYPTVDKFVFTVGYFFIDSHYDRLHFKVYLFFRQTYVCRSVPEILYLQNIGEGSISLQTKLHDTFYPVVFT